MAKSTEKPAAVQPVVQPAPVNVEVLAVHYQKTFEVAHDYWKERNRLFLSLAIAAGIGLLIILRVPEADKLLVDMVTKFLEIDDPTRKTQLYSTFPFDLVLSMILIVLFYLMQRLYSTNLSVMRNYLYLGAVEGELRSNLNLPSDSVSFTREGKFYWKRRMIMQTASKWYYIFVLFIILVPFMFLKIQADWQSSNWLLVLVDGVVSLMIVLYWAEYAYSAIKLDAPRMLAHQAK